MQIPRDVLESATTKLLGGEVKDFPLNRLLYLITVMQHATNLLLNEIERREKLGSHENGMVIVPYMSDHMVETILTHGPLADR